MTSTIETTRTTTRVRPRFEGSNICTWIGFKHVNYMVEEAVLDHLRQSGHAPGELYERYGLCVDIVDLDTRILTAFHIDDTAEAIVTRQPDEDAFVLKVELQVLRERAVRAVRSTVRVELRLDPRGFPVEDVPAELLPATVDRLGTAPVGGTAPVAIPLGRQDPMWVLTKDRNAHAWSARMPYYYCHFTERVQMSGYLRQMEQALDLFVAERGVSIKRLLDEQNWIPVVPQSRIRFLDEAQMEETMYTVFTVEQVFKRVTFTARMDCYVLRDDTLVPTATGTITHGWAVIENRRDWSLVDFDDRLLAALSGRLAPSPS